MVHMTGQRMLVGCPVKQGSPASVAVMKLPHYQDAVILESKITGYLLSGAHPKGRHKARFFARFGFAADRWEELALALRAHAAAHEVVEVNGTAYGDFYVIDGIILAPDGRTTKLRVVWCIDKGARLPRLITAHPLE